MTQRFQLKMLPPTTTHQSKKIVHAGAFTKLSDSEKLVAAKESYEAMLSTLRPPSPVKGATRLCMSFVWPYPSSFSKKQIEGDKWIRKTTKPDCSNLGKTLEDRLVTMRFLENDQQVAELMVNKFYGPERAVGVHVVIEELC